MWFVVGNGTQRAQQEDHLRKSMIRDLWNVTKVEISNEGGVAISTITCNCREKAVEEFLIQRSNVLAEYTYESDEPNKDFKIVEDDNVWTISFPNEDTKIIIKMENAKTSFDDELEHKHNLQVTWTNLDTQYDIVMDQLEECSSNDVKLARSLSTSRDYIRDMEEDI